MRVVHPANCQPGETQAEWVERSGREAEARWLEAEARIDAHRRAGTLVASAPSHTGQMIGDGRYVRGTNG